MPSEILRHAAYLLKLGHCRGTALAMTVNGDRCHPASPHAVSWSLHGALLASAYSLDLHHVLQGARTRAGDVCYKRFGLILSWADLSPNFGQEEAILCCTE